MERYVEAGGHVVATWRTGFCDAWGVERAEPWIARLLGARYRGRTQHNLKAAYALVGDAAHPVLAGMGDTDLLPLAGGVCEFDAGTAGSASTLRLIPPVEARAGSGMVMTRGTKFIRPVFLTVVILITLKMLYTAYWPTKA